MGLVRFWVTVSSQQENIMETFGTAVGAAGELKNLIADVEDLVARIADLKDVDVARVRTQVRHAMDAAKETIAERTESLRRRAESVAASADDFVHDRPWQAVGIAALLGALVGVLATRRS
jgi:ElaB/YqjD/DUF883 family membrane-anchored ribosome-binding protein